MQLIKNQLKQLFNEKDLLTFDEVVNILGKPEYVIIID